MTQKTISLPEEVYNLLKSKKRNDETFAEFFLRLLDEKELKEDNIPIESFFGSFEEETEEWEEIEKKLYKAREKPRNTLG